MRISITAITTDTTLTLASDRRTIRTSVAPPGAGPAEVIVPTGARYALPWVEVFGTGHQTDIEIASLERLPLASVPVARTFYVTMEGRDSNAGTSLTVPLATVAEGLARAAALGQAAVTIIQPGEYTVPRETVIPANCALYGYDLRVTKLRLLSGSSQERQGVCCKLGAQGWARGLKTSVNKN
ncbi:hypothetical protein [Tabrizicola sp.]|uniref:hypothetical protein n=1 Tax=Tabrizicola sp. TaxID=2005166 RepID=UPI001352D674|nr:hypothetical protein [Tabrizicola sp.]KAF0114645.1 MAG: hypothetical protein FD150_1432 [Paracoccaceae bacterium]MDP3197178.1 hypothetical protein [Tabrizicola sp.]MDZ4067909.1 hypothetical protein [Tabrizicola sp.]